MHNFVIETEKLVLSSILFNQTLLEQISITLKPNDFYFQTHKDIYETMLELYSEDMPIDEEFILKKSKKTINKDVLIEIISATPVRDVYKYANSIKDDSLRRQIQNLSLELQRNSQNENLSNDDIFKFLKSKQDEISSNNIVLINKNQYLM